MNPPHPSSPADPTARHRIAVILNRESGTLREIWHDGLPREIEDRFREKGAEAKVRPVTPDELDPSLDRALDDSPDAIVIGGGDGTVASAATRLSGSDTPLGILPFGTFNLAARDLGIPLELDEAIATLAKAKPSRIDVLQIGDRTCLCTALAGFYPKMAERQEEFHGSAWWMKSLRITRDSFRHFHRSPALQLKLETSEGERIQCSTRFAAFVPGDYDDIFSLMPRRVGLTDGRMTLYLSKHRGVAGFARASLAYLVGMLRMEKDLQRLRTRGVHLEARRKRELTMMIDGEILRLPLPLEIRIREKALCVLKPIDPA